MFEVLDKIFPVDLSNLIMGFLSDKYLVNPKFTDRIYHKTLCDLGERIPKKVFEQAVWKRRYKNPYSPEGVKLRAYNYVSLPDNRVRYILSRSFMKFQRSLAIECDCLHGFVPQHKIHHWISAIIRKLGKTPSSVLKRMAWNVSVPFLLYTFVYEFHVGLLFEKELSSWQDRLPDHIQWEKAQEYFWFMTLSTPCKTYPVITCIESSLVFALIQ